MADPIRNFETRTDSGSTSTLAFIIGGLVVAVAVIAYFLFGGSTMPSTGAGKTSITIDNTAPAATAPAASAPAATAPTAPAPAPAAPAPAAPNP